MAVVVRVHLSRLRQAWPPVEEGAEHVKQGTPELSVEDTVDDRVKERAQKQQAHGHRVDGVVLVVKVGHCVHKKANLRGSGEGHSMTMLVKLFATTVCLFHFPLAGGFC